MTLRELELFYYLSQSSHISELAKKLSISQSAISLAIKSLEKKLSEPLFDRIGKKLILNERGRIFKEKTYAHYLALQDAQYIFKQDKLSGVLKIASSKTIGDFIIPQLLFDFLLQNTNTKILKDITNSSNIIQLVLNGEIDMGIIETECNEPNIVKEELGYDKLVVISSNQSLANQDLYIDKLFDKKWILREKGSGTRDFFLNSLGDLAKELNVFMEFTEFDEMKTLIEKNDDVITCISKFVVAKELQRNEIFEVNLQNINLQRKLYIIYHKNKYQTELFQSFHQHIKDNLRQLL